MSDLEAQNQLVRENRLELTKLALENGVSPLKASEFGSRVADAIKQSNNTKVDYNDPASGNSYERVGSMLSAVFRDNASGELKAAVLDVGPDNKVGNAVKFADEDAMGIALAETESVGLGKPSEIQNYGFSVSPIMTAKP